MSFWTYRESVTAVHGLLFGAFLLAAYALFVELLRMPAADASGPRRGWAMGVFYVLGDASAACNRLLSIYPPAGALSGVSTARCFASLVVWVVLHRKWPGRDIPMGPVSIWSLLLLAGGLLLTFPPVARLF